MSRPVANPSSFPAPTSTPSRRSSALAFAAACAALSACTEAPTEPALEVEPSLAVTPFTSGRIVFVRDGDIWVMESNGKNQQNITNTPGVGEAQPALSPSGRSVAYTRDAAIWVMSVNGLLQRQVYSSGVGSSSEPAWSPDETRIAFTFRTHGIPTRMDVYEMDADGQNLTFYANDFQALEHSPTYHPVTGDVTYVRDGLIVGAGGSGLFGAGPVWNPDGTILAYYKTSPGMHDNFQIWVISRDGDKDPSNDFWLRASNSDYEETHPTWSPDGNKIAFQREATLANGAAADAEIWWMEAYAWRTIGELAGALPEPASRSPSWGNCGTVRFMPC